MEAYINNTEYVESLKAEIAKAGIDTSALVVVEAEYQVNGSRMSELKGLEFSEQFLRHSDKIVILVSFIDEQSLRDKFPTFAGLMSYPNVGFMPMPIYPMELLAYYSTLKGGGKIGNSFGRTQFEAKQQEWRMAKLRHDLYHVEQGSKVLTKQNWLALAQEAGLTGSFEEMADVVRVWQPTHEGMFQGKFLPGVFVDLFGTLADSNGAINNAVRNFVYELAEKQSVTVFTDSDLKVAQSLLAQHRIPFNLASKLELRGAELEVVIDDMPEDEFRKTYAITPRYFIPVSSITT